MDKHQEYEKVIKSLKNVQKYIHSADLITIKAHIEAIEKAKKEFDQLQNNLEEKIVQCRKQIEKENKNVSDKFSILVDKVENSLTENIEENNKDCEETKNYLTEIQSKTSEILELE